MKQSFLALLLLLVYCLCPAQTVEPLVSVDGPAGIEHSLIDSDGNLYLLIRPKSNFKMNDKSSQIVFEMGKSIVRKDNNDHWYVVKTNKLGVVLWEKSYAGNFHVVNMFLDSSKRLILVGGKSEGLIIEKSSIENGFILALDSKGLLLWLKQVPHYVIDAQIDNNEDVGIIGTFADAVSFDAITLRKKGWANLYIAEIDGKGKWTQAHSIDTIEERLSVKNTAYTFGKNGEAYVNGYKVIESKVHDTIKLEKIYGWNMKYCVSGMNSRKDLTLALGNVYNWDKDAPPITDCFGNVVNIGKLGIEYNRTVQKQVRSFGSYKLSSEGLDYEIFATKQDSTRAYEWAVQGGGKGNQYVRGACFDETGNIFLYGFADNNAVFGNFQYSSDPGFSFITMLSSDGKWVWTIPLSDVKGDFAHINAIDDDIYLFTSKSIYSIKHPSIELIYPNGGEKLQAKSTTKITWRSVQSIGGIMCKLSVDNGNNWINLNSSPIQGKIGYYSFTIPSIETSSCKIRLESAECPSRYYAESHRTFSITASPQPTIKLTAAPLKGQKLLVGNNYSISWDAESLVSVDIEASFNGGKDWSVIANDLNARDASYQWVVPDQVSKHCLLKVVDSNNSSIFDINYDEYSICRLAIRSPKPGTSLRAGVAHKIQVDSEGIELVNIDVSYDGGVTWSQLSKNLKTNDINVKWAMPEEAYEKILLRVSDAEQSSISTISTYDNLPFLKLSDPAERAYQDKHFERSKAKQPLVVGKEFLVSWKSRNMEGPYQLEYSVDNGKTYTFIIDDLPTEQNSYNWNVPYDLANKEIQIRISLMYDPTFNSTYKYEVVRHYEFTDSMEGKTLYSGSNYKIQYIGGFAQFHFSSDGGASWESIGPVPGVITGDRFKQPINWVVPTINSDRCLLKMSALDYLRVEVSSGSIPVEYALLNPWEITTVSKQFSIKKAITLLYPTGDERLTTNSIEKIRWKSENIVTQVTIEISYDNGASWRFIQSTPVDSSSGEYSWIVPEMTSEQCKLRIRDIQNSNISGVSEHVFSISN
ncbi:MAG TPA: hypothetical protein PL188_07825 [Candidatus Cloacimonadota bacterium]|nr:hypothetical protein [Candidatus Cloacimonadota bacterium]